MNDGLIEKLYKTALYLLLNITDKNKQHLKDIKEIRRIYDEIISNYNKINKDFGLKTPSEICTLYEYALFNGYLSKDKTFNYGTKNSNWCNYIQGAQVITGESFSRHIATMLADILVNYGIDSSTLFVEQKQINKVFPNHVITIARYEDESYLLDPTNFMTYRINPKNRKMLVNDFFQDISICNLRVLPNNILITKEMLELKNVIINKNEIEQKINPLFWSNLDIFERFYWENHEAYDDIADKIMKIKKKKKS